MGMDGWMDGCSMETRVSREREVRGPAFVQVRQRIDDL